MLAEKEFLLKEVLDRVDPSKGFIVTRHQKMTANQIAQFRSELVEAGGEFFALKKRVFLKAAGDLDLNYEHKELEGHIGLVIGLENFVSTTKALYKFKKANSNALEVLGGHFENKKCVPSDIEQISKLPTQDEMRAQLLGLLEAPMATTLSVMESILSSIVYCLDNKSKGES